MDLNWHRSALLEGETCLSIAAIVANSSTAPRLTQFHGL
jgi:hypothetical protein